MGLHPNGGTMKRISNTMAAALVTMSGVGGLAAQQPAPPPAGTALAAGVEAPDFALTASTMDGVAAKPLHLKALRGQTVVIAFFYRARTKG
jgi:cytochrome oxidase Cu insertion factor (SCO1/SenC/PrrC family)